MAARHSWEEPEHPPSTASTAASRSHSWESDSDHLDKESDGSSITDAEVPPDVQITEYCPDLYLRRVLSAAQLCTMMHFAKKCGVRAAEPLEFRPDAPTGHFARHLQTVMPCLSEHESLYNLPIPATIAPEPST